jgi:hypothetical protein
MIITREESVLHHICIHKRHPNHTKEQTEQQEVSKRQSGNEHITHDIDVLEE